MVREARALTEAEEALMERLSDWARQEYEGRVWSIDGAELYGGEPEEGDVYLTSNGDERPIVRSCSKNLLVKGSGRPLGAGPRKGMTYRRGATRRELEDMVAGQPFENAVRAAFGEVCSGEGCGRGGDDGPRVP